MSAPVLRATYWTSNADLIEACAQLGYLKSDWKTLDPTYGKGIWWKKWKPKTLVTHDLALDGVDFRNLPHSNGEFKAVTYDPPYVSVGGRSTTTIKEFYDRFGLTGAPTTPRLLQKLIDDGLAEVWRVLESGGYAMVKCQNYVSSGKLWPGVYKTAQAAEALGFRLVDELIHLRKAAGPQPQNRTRKGPKGTRVPSTQQHARGNNSVLLVLRKP